MKEKRWLLHSGERRMALSEGISNKDLQTLQGIIGKEEAKRLMGDSFHKKTPEEMLSSLDREERLHKAHKNLIEIIRKYCDLNEDYYNLIALWIIGTYMHKSFPTYPYLFFNAMRGSGKTRLLKLVACLSKNGCHTASVSESVIFRTASNRTFCFDEFESIGGKEKQALRELLNAAYKKGTVIERARKVKDSEGEGYEIETFDVYCPIAMANIWGMDNVLSDRCITLILEKSNDPKKTKLVEDFNNVTKIRDIIHELSSLFSDVSASDVTQEGIRGWNDYITSLTSLTTHTTLTPLTSLYNKINNSEIDGRHLELFFPLFLLSELCGTLDETIASAIEIVKDRKEEDMTESKDVSLMNHIAMNILNYEGRFVSIRELTNNFKEASDGDDWLNARWMGRALKRLNLVIQKRKVAKGAEVIIDADKARKKILMFTTSKWDGLERRKETKPIEKDRRKDVPES